ncbi:MAG: hypothetical protein ACI4C7_08495 [Clostridia bacterium]
MYENFKPVDDEVLNKFFDEVRNPPDNLEEIMKKFIDRFTLFIEKRRDKNHDDNLINSVTKEANRMNYSGKLKHEISEYEHIFLFDKDIVETSEDFSIMKLRQLFADENCRINSKYSITIPTISKQIHDEMTALNNKELISKKALVRLLRKDEKVINEMVLNEINDLKDCYPYEQISYNKDLLPVIDLILKQNLNISYIGGADDNERFLKSMYYDNIESKLILNWDDNNTMLLF